MCRESVPSKAWSTPRVGTSSGLSLVPVRRASPNAGAAGVETGSTLPTDRELLAATERIDWTISGSDDPNSPIQEYSEWLRCGTYDLALVDDSGVVRRLAAVVRGVEVLPNEWTVVEPITPNRGQHVTSLLILDETGRPVPRGWVARMNPLAEHGDRRLWDPPSEDLRRTEFAGGSVIFDSDEPLGQVAVGAPGFRSVLVRPRDANTVILTSGLEVAFELATLDAFEIPEGRCVLLQLIPDGRDPDWYRFGANPLPEAPLLLQPGVPAVTHLPAAGRIRVRLSLGYHNRAAVGNWSGTQLNPSPAWIEIEDVQGRQTIRVGVHE